MQPLWKILQDTVQVDARGLGYFRLVLGIILVVKFWGTVPRNFEQVFAPTTGLLGNCFTENYLQAYGEGSYLFQVQSDPAILGFSLAAGLVMLLFALGLYPQVMALIGSAMLWLWNDRFQMLWFGWEQYAQVLLTLCIFLPTGNHLSPFRLKRNNPKDQPPLVTGPILFVLLFQIGFIYFFNGISKNGNKWLDGTAVQFALGGIERQAGLGNWLLGQDFLAKTITYLTLAWEILLLPMLFIPWRFSTIRTLAAVSVPAFHWGLSLFMEVGDFKFVSIAVCLLLLPKSVWDWVPNRLTNPFPKKINLLQLSVQTPVIAKRILAGILVFIIIASNLKMSFNSKTEDRMQDWLGGGVLEEFVKTMMPDGLPRFSFMTQHWHLFSPNPPGECGYLKVELTHLDGRILPVFAGAEGVDKLPTKTLRFLMQYLSYDRKNKKAEVFASCLASREAHLWHEAHKGEQARALTLALYTWRPETVAEVKTGSQGKIQRVELIRLGFDY